jgi:hypothetical protein
MVHVAERAGVTGGAGDPMTARGASAGGGMVWWLL